MSDFQRFYTSENCTPAYQLRWSLSLFPSSPLSLSDSWISWLGERTESVGVRMLEACELDSGAWSFLLSTTPNIAPSEIVQAVKVRLQHVLRRDKHPTLRRNFSLSSVGDARRDVVEQYVASQLQHHQMADPRTQDLLRTYQIKFDHDLSIPQFSSHGRYLYNLHLCLVHEDRWPQIEIERLQATKATIISTAEVDHIRLSVVSICADHLHNSMGCHYTKSPEEIALAFLNNLANAHQRKPVYQHSYYVGTWRVRHGSNLEDSKDSGRTEGVLALNHAPTDRRL
jgi:REP element-mobilizing transposase RayT